MQFLTRCRIIMRSKHKGCKYCPRQFYDGRQHVRQNHMKFVGFKAATLSCPVRTQSSAQYWEVILLKILIVLVQQTLFTAITYLQN